MGRLSNGPLFPFARPGRPRRVSQAAASPVHGPVSKGKRSRFSVALFYELPVLRPDCNSPAQHSHGRGWQPVDRVISALNGGTDCWPIWVRVTIPARGMPLILIFPKGDHCNRPGKATLLVGVGIMERHPNRMVVIMVLVDQQHRPLSIRPQYCVSRN